jgi:replication factor C large subunit
MWTQKYRPSLLSDIIGNEKEIEKLKEWGTNWTPENPALIIYGPPGIGKTSSAYALAKEMNWEVLEMNASDKRTKNIVQDIAGESSKTATLSKNKRKLIIIDEADNLHGHSDRGGKKAITKVIKNARQPIILIANDFYDLSRTLRNKTDSIEFNRVDKSELARKLRDICQNENIEYEVEALKMIAKNAEGDIRGAINDLQKHGITGEITVQDLDQNSRDQNEDIFPFLDDILKSDNPKDVRNRAENLDMTPYDMYRWVERNIYYEYDADELVNGIEQLSKASRWLGIVNKSQNYKYWRYASDRLTAGVSDQRIGEHTGWTRWQPPKYNKGSNISDGFVNAITNRINCSQETVRTDIYPYLTVIIEYCKPEDLTSHITAWYNLDKSQLSAVTGSGKSTNKIERVLQNSEDLKSKFEIKQTSKNVNQDDSNNDNTESDNNVDDEEDNDSDNQTGLGDFM